MLCKFLGVYFFQQIYFIQKTGGSCGGCATPGHEFDYEGDDYLKFLFWIDFFGFKLIAFNFLHSLFYIYISFICPQAGQFF
jgi:hypothetical protein